MHVTIVSFILGFSINKLGGLMENTSIVENIDECIPTEEEFNTMKRYCKDLKMCKNLFLRCDFYISSG